MSREEVRMSIPDHPLVSFFNLQLAIMKTNPYKGWRSELKWIVNAEAAPEKKTDGNQERTQARFWLRRPAFLKFLRGFPFFHVQLSSRLKDLKE